MKYIKKDITTVTDGMVLHGCNCSGGFGSGVAGAIKRKWPLVEKMFRANTSPELGDIEIMLTNGVYVANGYTQERYGLAKIRYADPEAVNQVIRKAITFCHENKIENLYMPKIGCGLGGLNWEKDILPLIENIDTDINIYICEL
jgi:O-acetyl-ADP-ribose deacetylase (regulator of RNase III)